MPTALAGDASYSRPSAADLRSVNLVAIGLYTGNARPDAGYIKSLLDGGIGVWWIQETTSDRSLQGYQAGVLDAQYADRRVNEIASAIGFPMNTGKIWYAFSDGSASEPSGDGARNAMKDYARGIADTTTRTSFGAYGNRWAVDSARLGSPKCTGTWVPSSWDANSTDTIWQMANIANPLDGVDMDWVNHDLAEIGAWGLAQTPTKKDDDVPLYISKKSDPNQGIWVTDGVYKRHVLPDEWAFVQFVNGGNAGAVPISDPWWDSIPAALPDTSLTFKDLNNVGNTVKSVIPASSGGSAGVSLTADEVRGIVRDELNKTKLGS